jgi:ADP-ribosylglycohydrolase
LEDLKTFYPDLKGFEQPRVGHYHAGKKPGELTHYGEAALLLLESVAENGRLDVADYGRRFFTHFTSPSYRGYLDSATRGTIENAKLDARGLPPQGFHYQAGADDDQLATATSLAPVVACYFNSPDLAQQVERVTCVRQNHARSVAYMQVYAQILTQLLAGTDLHSAIHRVQESAAKDPEFGKELAIRFSDVFERKHLSTTEATAQLGQSCPLKNSFPSALLAVVQTPESFAETLLRVLAAGGDNAGRAAIAGAILGAHLGCRAIPESLRQQLVAKDRIANAVGMITQKLLVE